MRRLCIIVLAVLLISGGVGQALGSCSVDWGRSDNYDTPHSTYRTTIGQPGSDGNLRHGSSSIIHCLKLNLQIGPMIETSRIRTTGPSNHGVPPQGSVASGAGLLLSWVMHYHPKLFLLYCPSSISIPATSSFRVFLSVFQI